MFRGVALAPVTARLRRRGHVPAALLVGWPAGLVSAPAALTERRAAADPDTALARALAGLAAGSPVPEELARGATRQPAVVARAAPSPRPVRLPAGGVTASARSTPGFPDRAAGRGATVHGAVGGPSRLVHHVAGVDVPPAARSTLPVAPTARPAPPSSGAALTRPDAGTPAPARSAWRAGPVHVRRDDTITALLTSLAAPSPAETAARGAAAPVVTPRTDRPAPVPSPAAAARLPVPGAPGGAEAAITAVARPARRSGPASGGEPSAPGDLVELVRWWESAAGSAPVFASAAPAGVAAELAVPGGGAGDPGATGADLLSTFRDALELVLLDEALGDGLEVG